MKFPITILLATILSTYAMAADVFKKPASSHAMYIQTSEGDMPGIVVQTTDGSGEMIPTASRAQLVSLLASQAASASSLSSIDSKVTACNTGSVTVSSSALPSGAATSSAQSTANASLSSISSFVSSLDSKQVNASATALSAASSTSAQLVTNPGQWTSVHAPNANTIATTTKAAGGSGVRHVITGISATLYNAQALAASDSKVYLRDGASGSGTIVWAAHLGAIAGAGNTDKVHLTGLNIVMSSNTAATLEFASAPGSNSFEVVTLTGYDTQ